MRPRPGGWVSPVRTARFVDGGRLRAYTRRIELTAQHREILESIGEFGASTDALRHHAATREFDDLHRSGLIVFWPEHYDRPAKAAGAGWKPGAWYLTWEGAEAIDLPVPLFRTVERPR
jgi:hypothetical protein